MGGLNRGMDRRIWGFTAQGVKGWKTIKDELDRMGCARQAGTTVNCIKNKKRRNRKQRGRAHKLYKESSGFSDQSRPCMLAICPQCSEQTPAKIDSQTQGLLSEIVFPHQHLSQIWKWRLPNHISASMAAEAAVFYDHRSRRKDRNTCAETDRSK